MIAADQEPVAAAFTQRGKVEGVEKWDAIRPPSIPLPMLDGELNVAALVRSSGAHGHRGTLLLGRQICHGAFLKRNGKYE
jgi:hypothetical protein